MQQKTWVQDDSVLVHGGHLIYLLKTVYQKNCYNKKVYFTKKSLPKRRKRDSTISEVTLEIY